MLITRTVYQLFGKGFYFALNSSKSHCYARGPARTPQRINEKALLLCKVATGAVYEADDAVLRGKRPRGVVPGFHSTHYIPREDCGYAKLYKSLHMHGYMLTALHSAIIE